GWAQLTDKSITAPSESGLEGSRRGGEIGREGRARDIGVARDIDRYAEAVVGAAPVQVGGVDQGRSQDVELGDKASAAVRSGEAGLESTRGGGEIGGTGSTRDISVARVGDRYAISLVAATSAQVRGVEQSRAGGVHLTDKGIEVRAGPSGLEGARGSGEIGG